MALGGPPTLRERFFAALLRGEFSAPVLAPVDAGAILSPLGVEYAERPPLDVGAILSPLGVEYAERPPSPPP